jgi:hypothetical protein
VVVENFRTRPARTGIAHRPKIVALVALTTGLIADTGDAVPGDLNLVGPDLISLVVGLVNGHPQLIRRQLQHIDQKFPSEMNGLFLEIIAEAEITQHLEKRVMTSGITDIFEIVVLATGSHAALRGDRPMIGALVATSEHVLELHHAGVGE